jgi:transposase
VSIAAVAMSRGVNANLLRRWVAEAERDGRDIAVEPRVVEVPRPTPAAPAPSFMPVALPPPSPVAAADIRVELRRGGTAITVTWPSSAAAECASWMRELLK